MLAQPRVWPTVVLAQLGLFLLLFTRFWQRGAETSLALQNPIFRPSPLPILPVVSKVNPISNPIDPLHPNHPIPTPIPTHETPQSSQSIDPIPNPEPASPSLDEPDPGVFHHDPAKPPQ